MIQTSCFRAMPANQRGMLVKRMVYKGMMSKKNGTFAGPYIPDNPTPAAPGTLPIFPANTSVMPPLTNGGEHYIAINILLLKKNHKISEKKDHHLINQNIPLYYKMTEG